MQDSTGARQACSQLSVGRRGRQRTKTLGSQQKRVISSCFTLAETAAAAGTARRSGRVGADFYFYFLERPPTANRQQPYTAGQASNRLCNTVCSVLFCSVLFSDVSFCCVVISIDQESQTAIPAAYHRTTREPNLRTVLKPHQMPLVPGGGGDRKDRRRGSRSIPFCLAASSNLSTAVLHGTRPKNQH